MALPVWDSDTILHYKGRWKALNRAGSRAEKSPNSNSVSKVFYENNVFPEEGDLTFPNKLIRATDSIGRQVWYLYVGDEYRRFDLGGGKEVKEGDTSEQTTRKRLRYDSLYEGIAHLLYTQPGNPPHESLIRHLDGEKNRASYYRELTIPKKRGGHRTLTVPQDPLKWVQRSLLIVLTHLFPRHKCAHGFERGKSIVTHAKQHVARRYVYTIDIKDFFPSITRNRVFGMLRAFPIKASTPVARYLANLTCHNGCLPQGAPTSPILSNLLCRRLDSRLFKWARSNGYVYSRYADDLTFSTNRDQFPERDIDFIDDVIRSEGFEVNEEKRRLQPYYKRQMVTGLIVNEKVNVPREKLRGLRALLHNIEQHGWQSQVGRTPLFENAEAWREYINAEIAIKQFKSYQAKQAKKRKLLNPSATLPHVGNVDKLRRVVRGKIESVGAVRGKDDAIYQRMRQTFNRLSKRLDIHQKRKQEGAARIKEQDIELPPDEAARRENAPRHYETIKKWLSDYEDDKITLSEFRENLATWKEHSLEIGWLLDRTRGKQDRWISEVKKIAYRLDTDPFETAQFFRQFDNYSGFRGLLHSPTDQSLSPSDIIGACAEMLSNATLPNGLQNEVGKVIKKIDSWIDAHPGEYPWPPPGESTSIKSNVLIPFKRKTRFNHRKREEDLIARLKGHVEKLKGQGVDFEIPRKGKRFRTYVPSVLPAIKKLLESMAEHTKSDVIHLSVETLDIGGFDGVSLCIWDEDSSIEEEPVLERIFRGDTREVLYHQTSTIGLRGYARWTMIASFENGEAYEFDVMQNQRNEAPTHKAGVMHRITFPQ